MDRKLFYNPSECEADHRKISLSNGKQCINNKNLIISFNEKLLTRDEGCACTCTKIKSSYLHAHVPMKHALQAPFWSSNAAMPHDPRHM